MKKGLKLLGLVCAFAFGLLGLSACGEEASQKTAISLNDFRNYISREDVISSFVSYKCQLGQDIYAEVANVNGDTVAYMDVDTEALGATRVCGEVYLYNGVMYVDDNITEAGKYSISVDSVMTSSNLGAKLFYVCLESVMVYNNMENFATAISSQLENMVIFQTEDGFDTQFEFVYNAEEEVELTTYTQQTTYTVNFVKGSIQDISIVSTLTETEDGQLKDTTLTTSTIKKQLGGINFHLPNLNDSEFPPKYS